MPTQPLAELPWLLTVGMLIAMFASMLAAMAVLSRVVPTLNADAHADARWLDGLRGLAAATVALNHAPLMVFSLLLRPAVFGYSLKELILFGFFGSIGVQIFFCITGMLFANKVLLAEKTDWNVFFKHRLLRIVPAYFAACVLALIIATWISWPIHQPLREIVVALPSLFSFGLLTLPHINDFDFLRLLSVNWTLALEWRYYVMLPIVFILWRHLRWWFVVAIIIYAAGDTYLTGRAPWAWFISGTLAAPFMYRQFEPRPRAAAYAVLAIVVGVYARYWETLSFYGIGHWVLTTLLFISLTIARPWLLATKALVAMGSVSYSFYLLHCMILVASFYAGHRYLFDVTAFSAYSYTLFAGAGLIVACGAAVVSYLYVERPFLRVARGLAATPRSEVEKRGDL